MSGYNELMEKFTAAGQGHVFRFWGELNERERENLLELAGEIDLDEISRLIDTHLKHGAKQEASVDGIEPAPCLLLPRGEDERRVWENARESGETAIREGRVALFAVAGGQGTRLGYDGPKGTFPVTPVLKRPLFQVFAEKIRAAQTRYGCELDWYLMTSELNHDATVSFFRNHRWFGLNPDRVFFFRQGRMPAVDFEGKILMAEKDAPAMSPDGHGGSLRALLRSGALDRMESEGVDTISYFQIDNPLVKVIDPAFIGFHLEATSDMSSKMVPKAGPDEKVGNFCLRGEKLHVIEYSDMPAEFAHRTNEDGSLVYNAGSIGIHVLNSGFVRRMARDTEEGSGLPFHRAEKKVPAIDESGRKVNAVSPNGVKFEMFVFDALPYANNPLVLETRRGEEFSPVKNAEGPDSPQTARRDLLREYARWARACGVDVPVDSSGTPSVLFEVSPLFATDPESFAESWEALDSKPAIEEGTVLG